MQDESKGHAPSSMADRIANASIWWFAFGYFACYVPYSLIARAISRGLWWGSNGTMNGARLLPLSVMVSAVGMVIFLYATGLWRYAHQVKIGPLSIPRPSRGTFLSGLCTATIIATTTLAYTFKGISIVFAMLLMRGGVLMIAPMVDVLGGRKVRWFSWVGLFLSFLALVVAFWEPGGSTALNTVVVINISLYLAAYFVRLQLMSSMAKSDDSNKQWQYFAEEQIVGVSVIMALIIAAAVLGWGSLGRELALGFSLFDGGSVLVGVLLIGLFSQGTGIFGGLILLNKQENTFCVPVNRSSSILAGVLSSALLTVYFKAPAPSWYKLAGAGLIIAAILMLSIPPLIEKHQKRKAVGG
jgi:drug/metabolite transporter (DMT)-like permease